MSSTILWCHSPKWTALVLDAHRAFHGRVRPPVAWAPIVAAVIAGVAVAGLLVGLPSLLAPERPSVGEEPAIVMGEDGVPTSIDGLPVLRGAEIRAAMDGAADDARFLVGGWVVWTYPDCEPAAPTLDLVDPCRAGPYLVDRLTTGELPLRGEDLTRIVLARLPAQQEGRGPFVFEAHVRDETARLCDPPLRDECDHALVADALIWMPDL